MDVHHKEPSLSICSLPASVSLYQVKKKLKKRLECFKELVEKKQKYEKLEVEETGLPEVWELRDYIIQMKQQLQRFKDLLENQPRYEAMKWEEPTVGDAGVKEQCYLCQEEAISGFEYEGLMSDQPQEMKKKLWGPFERMKPRRMSARDTEVQKLLDPYQEDTGPEVICTSPMSVHLRGKKQQLKTKLKCLKDLYLKIIF